MYSYLSTIFWLDLCEVLGLKGLYYIRPQGLHIQQSILFVGSHATEKKTRNFEFHAFKSSMCAYSVLSQICILINFCKGKKVKCKNVNVKHWHKLNERNQSLIFGQGHNFVVPILIGQNDKEELLICHMPFCVYPLHWQTTRIQ